MKTLLGFVLFTFALLAETNDAIKYAFEHQNYLKVRELCESALKTNPNDALAKDYLKRSEKECQKLSKEAYTHGFIAEGMGKEDDAMKFWVKALQFCRPGDEYFDKSLIKLRHLNIKTNDTIFIKH